MDDCIVIDLTFSTVADDELLPDTTCKGVELIPLDFSTSNIMSEIYTKLNQVCDYPGQVVKLTDSNRYYSNR